jgi:branched-chain amino acid transport system ATP-binding protein
MSEPLLSVAGLHSGYGRIEVLREVDVSVGAGEIVALIGANGAGKSTLLKTIAGLIAPHAGTITYDGASIGGRRPEKLVRHGISLVPEGRLLFGAMSVAENLELGGYSTSGGNAKTLRAERLALVHRLFPVLAERASQAAATLSGGEQQMLAVARALMLRPRLMLLDEPSFGLAPLIVRDLFKILGRINREDKVTILVVEQNAQLALELADQAYVIETGRIVMSGGAKEISNDENVRKSYLGY